MYSNLTVHILKTTLHLIRTAIPVIIIDYPTNQAENFSWMQSVSKNLFLVFGGKASERERAWAPLISLEVFHIKWRHYGASYLCLLTGWESFHQRNNGFREHNTLFSKHMQPSSVYTYNTAYAGHRWPLWYNDRIVSYQHVQTGWSCQNIACVQPPLSSSKNRKGASVIYRW